jgi:hypothetical protein
MIILLDLANKMDVCCAWVEAPKDPVLFAMIAFSIVTSYVSSIGLWL